MEIAHQSTTSLSEIIGVSDRQVRRWLNGESDPSSKNVADLATTLNVSSDYLLGLSDDPTPAMRVDNLNKREMAILSALRRGDERAAMRIIVNG
jgi:transcriptional regulator with XRE-family HTH domain